MVGDGVPWKAVRHMKGLCALRKGPMLAVVGVVLEGPPPVIDLFILSICFDFTGMWPG